MAAGRKTAPPKIRSKEDLDLAIKKLDALVARAQSLSSKEQVLLRKLTERVRDYEETHCPIPEVSNAAILNHLLQTNAMTPKQLAEATGVSSSIIAALLRGDAKMSPNHASKIARRFRLRSGVFDIED